MKNKFKLLALFGLSLLTSSVVSCSSFFGDDGYVISSHSVSVDPTTGNTLLTIVFSSEEVEPLTISIPKGIKARVEINNCCYNLNEGKYMFSHI